MNVECSDLWRCIECHNCNHPDDSKISLLGKRKRLSFPLNEISEESIPKVILSPLNHKESGYFVKARKAKENRYLKFNDYSVELLNKRLNSKLA